MSGHRNAAGHAAGTPHASSRSKLIGRLDEEALRGALDDVLSGLAANAGVARPPYELSVTELAHASAIERRAELESLVKWDTHLPFELPDGPLLRVRVIELAQDAQVLLLTAHRSVCAVWPVRRLQAAIAARYIARRGHGSWGAPRVRPPALPDDASAMQPSV